jgi:hypothetical protein
MIRELQIGEKLRKAILLSLILISKTVYSQCEVKNKAFTDSERLEYTVFYNLSFIWVEAGEVIFQTRSEIYQDREVYHLIADGHSLPDYDWIYKVNDRYESWVDKNTLLPYKFTQNTSEGDYKTNQTYTFDYQKSLIYTKSEATKKKSQTDTFKINRCLHDLISSMYFARNLDFGQFTINQKIPFGAIIDNQPVTLYGRCLGKETLTLKDGSRYRCTKFAALVLAGSVFSGGEDLRVWVSDDENKIPVLVESKIRVGSVKVYLRKTENLRNKQTALSGNN